MTMGLAAKVFLTSAKSMTLLPEKILCKIFKKKRSCESLRSPDPTPGSQNKHMLLASNIFGNQPLWLSTSNINIILSYKIIIWSSTINHEHIIINLSFPNRKLIFWPSHGIKTCTSDSVGRPALGTSSSLSVSRNGRCWRVGVDQMIMNNLISSGDLKWRIALMYNAMNLTHYRPHAIWAFHTTYTGHRVLWSHRARMLLAMMVSIKH